MLGRLRIGIDKYIRTYIKIGQEIFVIEQFP
jgi:hypothetical protein